MHDTKLHWLALSLNLVVALSVDPGLAQGSDKAAAEALFEEGRALLEQGEHTRACPKLAESQRIDPATGTLLALALCHEGQGKLASAWAEFKQVEGQARSAGRADRETLARERSADLQPRISTLTLSVSPSLAEMVGFELRIDGARVGPVRYDAAFPIDGGEYRIEASAPGKKRWHTSVVVEDEADRVVVTVPALQPAPTPERPRLGPPGPRPPPVDRGVSTGMRSGSYIAAGAGLVAIGVGSALAVDAKADYDAAKADCGATACAEDAYQAGEDARSQGNVATLLFVVGGAAVATGAVLWLLAPSEEQGAFANGGPRATRLGLGAGGLLVEGSF